MTPDKLIQAVVFDWAGTTIDYGCQAPVQAFTSVLADRDVSVTEKEVRAFMGLPKREHLRCLLELESVKAQWAEATGTHPAQTDLDVVYDALRPAMLEAVATRTELIPGVVEVVGELRERGVKIGSTTGYDAAAMATVSAAAAEGGYVPDVIVTPDGLPAGRPAPYMMYTNAIELDVYPMARVMKAGDTIADIEEGRSAGAWSIGIVLGSSELGLDAEQVATMGADDLSARIDVVRGDMIAAGAHLVIDSIVEIPEAIDSLEMALADGWFPDD